MQSEASVPRLAKSVLKGKFGEEYSSQSQGFSNFGEIEGTRGGAQASAGRGSLTRTRRATLKTNCRLL